MPVFYGDDSGSATKGGDCLVAGNLAVARDCFYELEVPWNQGLAQTPAIRYFKAFQCKTQTGGFKDWPAADAEAKLMCSADAISRKGSRILEFSSSIRWEDFESSVTGGLRSVYTNPYFFPSTGSSV